MIYKPKMVAKMWDTWMYHDRNTYFLYYLVGRIGLLAGGTGGRLEMLMLHGMTLEEQ